MRSTSVRLAPPVSGSVGRWSRLAKPDLRNLAAHLRIVPLGVV
jgi:hypothetical protein